MFVVTLALSRIPHVLPWDFSVVYAFIFCSGVYFRGLMKWWLPLGTVLVTDLGLYFFYFYPKTHTPFLSFLVQMLPNYGAYVMMIWLGGKLGARASFWKLVGGSFVGAAIFYLVTNTVAWLQIPDYARTFAGWMQALWTGLPGYPPTWEFFRNAFLSTGLFTAFFVAAEKLTVTAESPADKTAGAREPEPEAEPEEAGA